MKVVFFSNYLNHHQLAFCQAMDRLTDHQFIFVAFTRTPQFRINLGYQEMNDAFSFVLKAYESTERRSQVLDLALNCDLLIAGTAPEGIVQERIKRNLPVFRISERLYRNTELQAFSPRGMLRQFKNHTRFLNKKVYMLCASAYTSLDFLLSGAYIGKAYKWGYFPESKEYDPDELWREKLRQHIIWVGRFIELKHPEMALMVAERLKKEGIPFTMELVGSGKMENDLKQMIEEKNLKDVVCLSGNMSPKDVRLRMEKAGIFMFTSDFREGWGAVLNEAMNSGCAVIASHAIGSVPYLISDGKNGYVYENGETDELYAYTQRLLMHPEESERLGKAAYQTISKQWNAEIAAERILALSKDLSPKRMSHLFSEGPCSRAKAIGNRWYKRQNK